MHITTTTAAAAERRSGESPDSQARAEVAARRNNDGRPRPGNTRYDHTRHRARRALASAGALAVLALGGPACSDDSSAGDDERTAPTEAAPTTDAPRTTEATTIEPAQGTTAPGGTEPAQSSEPVLDAGTEPITWRGIGEILYGDTLRSVQRTEGTQFTWSQEAFENFGRVCFTATAPGLDLTFLVRSPDGNPLADPLDGAIDVIGGRDARTESGLGAGNTVTDIESIHGEPHEVHDIPLDPGQQLMVWRFEGGAYGFVIDGGVATQVWSGDVSPDDIEPCA